MGFSCDGDRDGDGRVEASRVERGKKGMYVTWRRKEGGGEGHGEHLVCLFVCLCVYNCIASWLAPPLFFGCCGMVDR